MSSPQPPSTLTTAQRWIGLIVILIVCQATGGLGAIATTPQIDTWYAQLNKPSWNPPPWVFGPVWTTLFVLMGIAAWLVWKQGGFKAARLPLSLFGMQLLLNLAWSWIFFHFHAMGIAFFELLALWVAIAACIATFWNKSKVGAMLLLPYLAWVSFAGLLNFTLWQLNAG